MTEPTRPPTRTDLQRQLIYLADLAAMANEAAKHIRKVLPTIMEVGDKAEPTIPTGDPIEPPAGTVTYRRPSQSVMVTAEDVFRAWVDDNYPGEIELVERVRPAFMSRFIDANGIVVGPSGEIDIPGIAVVTGSPSIAVVTNKKNLDQLRGAMRDLTVGDLLTVRAIEGPSK
jgi:hypothetical protein